MNIHGTVCFSFDDRNFQGWLEHLPFFQRYGAHASFFVSGPIEQDTIVAMRALHAQGHTVGLHTLDHVDAPPFFETKGPDAYLKEQVLPQLNACRQAGLDIHSFSYPNNARTPETDRVMHTLFRRLRAGVGPNPLPASRFIPYAEINSRTYWGGSGIGSYYGTELSNLLKLLETAARDRSLLVFFSHDIATEPSFIGTRTDWLEACLQKATQLQLNILGFDEL